MGICLMVATLLAQARSAIQVTSKIPSDRFAHHNEDEHVPEAKCGVDKKAIKPDAFLTTVREFHFIMITKEELVAVELHAFQNPKNSRHESWLTLRAAIPFNIA